MNTTPLPSLVRHDAPVLLAIPHAGNRIPPALLSFPAWQAVDGRLADRAAPYFDEAAKRAGVSTLSGTWHPCVIDLNQSAENRSLIPSFSRTGLCRTHSSRGEALYEGGAEPTEQDVTERVERYWRPYHDALREELTRLRGLHDHVLLLVSHASCRLSPYRGDPGAADFNFGTSQGRSCDKSILTALADAVQREGASWVVNGRIADAFAAQHYGAPQNGIHVIEVEVAGQCLANLLRDEAADMSEQDRHRPFDAVLHAALGVLSAAKSA
jgi:N-formylglutamate amidohydrolase